jgi:hypothetical protein
MNSIGKSSAELSVAVPLLAIYCTNLKSKNVVTDL